MIKVTILDYLIVDVNVILSIVIVTNVYTLISIDYTHISIDDCVVRD